MLIILAIWQVEIGRTTVQGQPRQIVCKTTSPAPTPSLKITRAKWTENVDQVVHTALKV
jgi:hypothetical protein